MRYLRKWDLPTLDEPVIEHLERPDGWGAHYFLYCTRCRQIYASVMVSPEDCSSRTWHAIGGLCLTCSPNRFLIRGDLVGSLALGLEVPHEVLSYSRPRDRLSRAPQSPL
jgi:hypothetical protein